MFNKITTLSFTILSFFFSSFLFSFDNFYLLFPYIFFLFFSSALLLLLLLFPFFFFSFFFFPFFFSLFFFFFLSSSSIFLSLLPIFTLLISESRIYCVHSSATSFSNLATIFNISKKSLIFSLVFLSLPFYFVSSLLSLICSCSCIYINLYIIQTNCNNV